MVAKRLFLAAFIVAAVGFLFSTPSAAVDCGTDCVRNCQWCVNIWGIGERCLPPEPTCMTNCAIIKTADCARRAARQNDPLHGLYCGWGDKTGGNYSVSGVDALDEACKRHDQCWGQRGLMTCSCDKTLAAEAAAVAADSRVPGGVRQTAGLVATHFGNPGLFCVPP